MSRIKEIREYQRIQALAFQQEDPGIYNPDVSGLLDKSAPITSEEKALALGFEATSPKRLLDLPPGDAGCGESMFRLSHVFYDLSGPGGGTLAQPRFAPYSNAVALATQRSADQKPRYWHVSIYGIGVRRFERLGGPLPPLSLSELQSRQFEAIYGALGAVETDITPPFIPSVPTCQARVLVHDESGGRYVDVDVIGTRSMTFYGFGATVFLLIKPDGYEVNPVDASLNEDIDSRGAGVEDDLVGARVLPIATNATQNRDQRTITVITDIANGRTFVPIPPGALTVQVINHDSTVDAAAWDIRFDYNRINPAVRGDLGFIDMIFAQSRSPVMEIPNAPAISFDAAPATPSTQWSLVFEVTA